jgi:DNA-binding HxlR family transcriptional regulator
MSISVAGYAAPIVFSWCARLAAGVLRSASSLAALSRAAMVPRRDQAESRRRAVWRREGDHAVRERRSGRLLARVRWPLRGSGSDASAELGRDGPGAENDVRHGLDWQLAQEQLGPVRHRWDLAILCNLNADAGCRPADILAGINARTEAGRKLSPQVLSGRLRELEQSGYIRHEDLSVMPLHRVYYLLPPGGRLIADLLIIIR